MILAEGTGEGEGEREGKQEETGIVSHGPGGGFVFWPELGVGFVFCWSHPRHDLAEVHRLNWRQWTELDFTSFQDIYIHKGKQYFNNGSICSTHSYAYHPDNSCHPDFDHTCHTDHPDINDHPDHSCPPDLDHAYHPDHPDHPENSNIQCAPHIKTTIGIINVLHTLINNSNN